MITSSFSDTLGRLQIPALDLASRYDQIAATVRQLVIEQIDDEYGLDCPQLFVVNISLPEAVEKALDTRTSMGVIGDMQRFQQYQMGQAMTGAAENPSGGGASEGMGLGMGFAMANQMMRPGGAGGGMLSGTAATGGPHSSAPPPPPPSAWHIAAGGETRGPFSPQQIAAAIESGEVRAESMVWTSGMQTWQAAGSLPQWAAYFVSPTEAPPPPPASE